MLIELDVDRTWNVGCTEICGVSPTKNHREKTVDVATLDEDSPYVLVMVLPSPCLR